MTLPGETLTLPLSRRTGRGKLWLLLACGLYLLTTLIVLGDALFSGGTLILSHSGLDLSGQFVGWRFFGFSQLSQGHLALWNPHLFSGTPFLGGFQSALLYPLNWHYVFMPVEQAINVGIALHVFLAGLFMYCWTRYRGLHPIACILSGFVFMFGGAYFLHIFAGHLPNLCTMIWAPLIFLAIDDLTLTRSLRGAWLGAGAAAMQILAGHPQYVFYTAVIAGTYALLSLWNAQSKTSALLGYVLIGIGGAALSAAQLFTGIQATNESVRHNLGRTIAASFSFAPENLLTMIMPGFFGDNKTAQSVYWGRWFLWEDSLYIGVAALCLACVGIWRGPRRMRAIAIVTMCVAFVLALGSYTPLFDLLYHLPGFNSFRGLSKFIFLVLIFLAFLCAVGLDQLLAVSAKFRKFPIILTAAAGAILLVAAWITFASASSGASGMWGRSLAKLNWDGFARTDFVRDDAFFRRTGHQAAMNMAWAGGLFLIVSGICLAARYWRRAIYALPLLAAVELVTFAMIYCPTFKTDDVMDAAEQWRDVIQQADPGVRLYTNSESSMLLVGGYDAWGTDPMLMDRYGKFMAASQEDDPQDLPILLIHHPDSPMFRMVRLAFLFDRHRKLFPVKLPMLRRAQLIGNVQVVPDPDQRLQILADPKLDPFSTVILDSPVDPMPAGNPAGGDVRIRDISTDEVEVNVTATKPAILLITDSYSKGWRVRSLDPSPPQDYSIVPADHAFQGIALKAGTHHLRLEYLPEAWVIGKWVNIAALLVYFGLAGWWLWRSRKAPAPPADQNAPTIAKEGNAI